MPLGLAATALLAAGILVAAGPARVDAVPAKPSDLIGQWSAAGDDVEPGTVLNVSAGTMEIFTSCGVLGTDWVVRADVFLAEVTTWVGNCFHRSQKVPEASAGWLDAVTRVGVAGPGRLVLLDAAKGLVATLTPAAHPPPIPEPAAYTTDESDTRPPRVSAAARTEMDGRAPAFPAGVRPARADELVGMWLPVREEAAYLWFKRSGRYRGSDGCNGMGGRWRVADGQLLWTRGFMTEVGCNHHLDPIEGVVLAGFDGPELVLVDGTGHERVRLIRTPEPTATRSR